MNAVMFLPDGDRLLKLSEVAQALRASIKTVISIIESGKLLSVKIRGRRLVRASALQNYLESLD